MGPGGSLHRAEAAVLMRDAMSGQIFVLGWPTDKAVSSA